MDAKPGVTDFHLMHGGPIYRWMLKLHLQGVENAFVHRRSLLLISVTWVPILLLCMMEGTFLPGNVRLPFLYDFPSHVLFLIALPLFILAEPVIEPGIAKTISELIERNMVRDKDRVAYEAIIAWARKACESRWSELVIVLLAIMPFMFVKGSDWAANLVGSWALNPATGRLSLAGIWSTFVGGFFARAFLFRWVWRLVIWTRMLMRIGKLDLNLVATHPDRVGGLGFMAEVEMKFGILAFAVAAVTSSNVAANIIFHNATLSTERLAVMAFIVGATLVLLLPLLALSGALHRTWRRGMRDYGRLACSYVQQFDRKWVHGEERDRNELLGSADIQSLADLANSLSIVQDVKMLPINRRCIVGLVLSAAVPMLPLVFLDEWAMQIARQVFARLL